MDTQNTASDISKLTIDRSSTNEQHTSISYSGLFILTVLIIASLYWFTNQSQAQNSKELLHNSKNDAVTKNQSGAKTPSSSQVTQEVQTFLQKFGIYFQ